MKVPSFIVKAGFKLAKHSPVILVGVGIAGVIASTVAACAATRHLDEIINDYKEKDDYIRNIEEYTDKKVNEIVTVNEKKRKELLLANKMQVAGKLIKLYGLPALGFVVSIACILGAHIILRRRNAILTASLASATKAFDEYRKRVADRFGDDVERQIRYNMVPNGDPVTVIDVDEDGKTHKSKVQNYAIDPSAITPDDSIVYFTKGYSGLWKDSDIANEATIEQVIGYLKEMLEKNGHLFLNDIRNAFQTDLTVGGQALGYDYDLGDMVDIRYSAQAFVDPLAPKGTTDGYVVEVVGLRNILDTAFKTKHEKQLVAM